MVWMNEWRLAVCSTHKYTRVDRQADRKKNNFLREETQYSEFRGIFNQRIEELFFFYIWLEKKKKCYEEHANRVCWTMDAKAQTHTDTNAGITTPIEMRVDSKTDYIIMISSFCLSLLVLLVHVRRSTQMANNNKQTHWWYMPQE